MMRLAIATCLVTLFIAQTVWAHSPSSTPAGSGSQQASVEEEALGPDKWPTTVQATVADLLDALSPSDKDTIRRTSKEDLIQFHHGWGTGIRNHYGLWRGNKQLLEDACGKGCHPDDASMVIIEAVWTALQTPEGSSNAADPSECMTLHDWGDVPDEARASLEQLVGPVAGKHDDFNSSDVAWGGLPMNRFFSGCRQGDLVAVSLERGGRGYSIQVFHYSAGKATKRWSYMRTKDPDAIDLLHAPPEEARAR